MSACFHSPLTLALLAVVVVGPRAAAAQIRYDSLTPRFGDHTGPIAAQAGWPALNAMMQLGGRKREIRIWDGFGINVADAALRIVEDSSGVTGTMIVYWAGGREPSFTFAGTPAERARWRATWDSATTATRADNQRSLDCRHLWVMQSEDVCEPSVLSTIRWSYVLARLDSLGIMALPDQSTLSPREEPGEDGETIVVEILSTHGYRTLSYWTPEAFHTPFDARAHEIQRIIKTLVTAVSLRP